MGLAVNIIQNTTIAQVIGANELLESGETPSSGSRRRPRSGEVHAFEIYGAVMVVFDN